MTREEQKFADEIGADRYVSTAPGAAKQLETWLGNKTLKNKGANHGYERI